MKTSLAGNVARDWRRNKSLYLILLPVLVFYIMFAYQPMYGALIAFQNYRPGKSFIGSEWVGLDQFVRFFNSPYFWRLLRNTLSLSMLGLLIGFPMPIILALMLNEVTNTKFKKTIQTITYMPHFISIVVVCGMIVNFTMSTGLVNDLIVFFGGKRTALLQRPELYRTIYIVTDIWQAAGWGSIIYLSALSGVDAQLYEAAMIDGAGKWRQLWNVTLPSISSIIVIMLILRLGSLMSLGYEKTILLYNPATYETADIISSYVYRSGIQERNWSYSTAIGLFNSVVNFILLIGANQISRRFSETSLW